MVATPTYPALNPTWQGFNPTPNVVYSFSPKTNSLVGTYGMSLKGTLTTNTGLQILAAYTITTFLIEVRINTPPTFDAYSFQLNNEMYSYHKWNVTAKFLLDAEANEPMMDAKIATFDSVNAKWVPLVTQPAFFVVNKAVVGDLYIEFNQPPQPTGNAAS